MVIVIIFWSAVLAVLFFVGGIFFRTLASALNAILSAIGSILIVTVATALTSLALFCICQIVRGIIDHGLWAVLGWIALTIIAIVVICGIVLAVGETIFEIVIVVVSVVLEFTSRILDGIAKRCEQEYEKFLAVITKRLNDC